MDSQAPLSMGFPGKNTGVGGHFLLQGVFPTRGWSLRLSSPALAGRLFATSAAWEGPRVATGAAWAAPKSGHQRRLGLEWPPAPPGQP